MKYDLNEIKESCINHIITRNSDLNADSLAKMINRFNANYDSFASIINQIEDNSLWQMILKTIPKNEMMETLADSYWTNYNDLYCTIDKLETLADHMMMCGCCPVYVVEYYINRYYNFYYYA